MKDKDTFVITRLEGCTDEDLLVEFSIAVKQPAEHNFVECGCMVVGTAKGLITNANCRIVIFDHATISELTEAN